MNKNGSEKKNNVLGPDPQVEESLRSIYASDGGEMPDMSKLERKPSKRWLYILIIVTASILTLCSAAWAGFIFFKGYTGLSSGSLKLEIKGSEQVTIGQETEYVVNYSNDQDIPLDAVHIRINFPADFVLIESMPAISGEGMDWKIGSLAAEQSGSITVKGRFTGALGTVSAVQAVATYAANNKTDNREILATQKLVYAQSVLDGSISVPEKAVPGDKLKIVYVIKNNGTQDLSGLEARISVPQGFTPDDALSTTTTAQGKYQIIKVSPLPAASSTQVAMSGTFSAGMGGQAHFQAQAGMLSAEGKFMMAQSSQADLPVLAGDLSIKLIINGSDQTERSAALGEILQGSIGFENTSDESLKNIRLRLQLDAINPLDGSVLPNVNVVDWKSVQSATSSKLENKSVVWGFDRIKDLQELTPHQSGNFEFSAPILTQMSATGTLAVRVTVFAEIESIGNLKMNRKIQLTPFIFKLKSDATLQSEARYYSEEGAPLGKGPLPPRVGQATEYRVIWSLHKSAHALKDVKVTTILPQRANFVRMATGTAGELSFDPANRSISWNLNRMPADVNDSEMQFDIELVPGTSDEGRFVDLTGAINFQAMDDDIKDTIVKSLKALNTDLQNDEQAKGKGVVRK
ncbi:MAG: hypothetical protein WCW31_04540 [Patescibacteria group bacterium]